MSSNKVIVFMAQTYPLALQGSLSLQHTYVFHISVLLYLGHGFGIRYMADQRRTFGSFKAKT
jgi:hypothetical protein